MAAAFGAAGFLADAAFLAGFLATGGSAAAPSDSEGARDQHGHLFDHDDILGVIVVRSVLAEIVVHVDTGLFVVVVDFIVIDRKSKHLHSVCLHPRFEIFAAPARFRR